MKGYKAFNTDWTCRGKQYQVGKTYEEACEPRLCSEGMHFCARLSDVFRFYPFDKARTVVAEIEALGEIITDDIKYCTNKLRIEREIPWDEILPVVNNGLNNTGLGNDGEHNSGNYNVGFWNSGDRNNGHRNTGNDNPGHRNTGDKNSGSMNSGFQNSGHKNCGDNNSGDQNTGNNNHGDRNTGDHNEGSCNTGYYNLGFGNSGNWNTGDDNTGFSNKGRRNSGNCNIGNGNSGDWNRSSHNSGCFMTVEPTIMMFNKPTNWTYYDWENSHAKYLLDGIPEAAYEFISKERMSIEEKGLKPGYKTTGGILRFTPIDKVAQTWWNECDEYDQCTIMSLPNFDPLVFWECTGIDTFDCYKKAKKAGRLRYKESCSNNRLIRSVLRILGIY